MKMCNRIYLPCKNAKNLTKFRTLFLLNSPSSNLEKILTAVLLKLNTATTLTVQQALLLVFARLASADTQGLLSFLNAKNALQPLMQLWLEKQGEVFGSYERRVTVAGLCTILKFAAQNGNAELLGLTMKRKVEVWLSKTQKLKEFY